MAQSKYTLFSGNRTSPLNTDVRQLPTISPQDLKDPEKYRTPPDLVAAVNVAMTLGMPLLLTGEPGCGKSQLAYRVAWELGFLKTVEVNGEKQTSADVEKFSVKSTTESSDLFYTFDTIGRFHASRNEAKDNGIEARNFIHYQALGRAILNGLGQENAPREIMSDAQWQGLSVKPARSILLIDEIDKAPRDVPNDILNEIDDMAFSIPELQRDQQVQLPNELQRQYRPIVIITSNSERDLPEAFLRRCVFYHVGFPKFASELNDNDSTGNTHNQITVEDILQSQFPDYFTDDALRKSAVTLMQKLRSQVNSYHKAPSMAEFINCFDFLFKYTKQQGQPITCKANLQSHFANMGQTALLRNATTQTLFKTRDDVEVASRHIDTWINSNA